MGDHRYIEFCHDCEVVRYWIRWLHRLRREINGGDYQVKRMTVNVIWEIDMLREAKESRISKTLDADTVWVLIWILKSPRTMRC